MSKELLPKFAFLLILEFLLG